MARKSFSDNSLLSDPGGERERIVVPILIESEYRGYTDTSLLVKAENSSHSLTISPISMIG